MQPEIFPMNTTTHPVAAIIAAHTLLGRMVAAAHRAGDIGREFVTAGLQRLVGVEIAFRCTSAAEAGHLADDCEAAERLVSRSLANDGQIDATEATTIRAALRKPAREARRLAASLDLPV
jgi:hypothetical protein